MDQWLAPSAVRQRAFFRTRTAWGVEALTDDPRELETGFHVLVQTFEGELLAARMGRVVEHDEWATASTLSAVPAAPSPSLPPGPLRRDGGRGGSQASDAWVSDLTRGRYEAGVESIREAIARGDVYQVNLCRTLTSEATLDLDALFLGILTHNPARHAARIDIDGLPQIVSASPELYLARDGAIVSSSPIKGTATDAASMLAKDVTENVMITDLVRNDLQRVCRAGSIRVDPFLQMQQHPGLVHLVSTVHGELRDDVSWGEILDRTGPPGSVSGAPKASALGVIASLESAPRGPYCGAIGWIDGDRHLGELAVGIRTFWQPRTAASPGSGITARRGLSSRLTHFGVGAGITWDSDPAAEWDETELKARRLLALARGAMLTEES